MKVHELLTEAVSKLSAEDLEKIQTSAVKALFAMAENEVKKYAHSIPEAWYDMPIEDTLHDFFKNHEDDWSPQLEKLDKKLKNSGGAVEKMFKEKYGMSSAKWIAANRKKELASLPPNEQKLFKVLSNYLTMDTLPSDIARGDFVMHKVSPKGLYVEAFRVAEVLRKDFFDEVNMSMEQVIEIFEKHGAKMGKRPPRPKFSPPIYD